MGKGLFVRCIDLVRCFLVLIDDRTVLVYLTSNDAGATTFPLATRYPRKTDDIDHHHIQFIECAKAAAKTMILELCSHHTRETVLDKAALIEDAAVRLWEREDEEDQFTSSIGIRIRPKAGHFCVFSGISPK